MKSTGVTSLAATLPWRSIAAVLALMGAAAASPAQTIYRCEQGGRVTYSDVPCVRPPIPASAGAAPQSSGGQPAQSIAGGGYESPYGAWRGQAQYRATHSSRPADLTHYVVPLVIEIQDGGKVVGASQENGCRMLGVASPGFGPNMLSLDVTLSNCAAPDLNVRYGGTLIVSSQNRWALLSLIGQRIGIGTVSTSEIKATMRR